LFLKVLSPIILCGSFKGLLGKNRKARLADGRTEGKNSIDIITSFQKYEEVISVDEG
jgi:hypothetical protein